MSRVVVALGGNALLRRGEPAAAPILDAVPEDLRELAFAAGSMGSKIEAACRFVERTGGEASIGSLAAVADVAAGRAGTQVRERNAIERGAKGRVEAWT